LRSVKKQQQLTHGDNPGQEPALLK
jgi:hypothetical protein